MHTARCQVVPVHDPVICKYSLQTNNNNIYIHQVAKRMSHWAKGNLSTVDIFYQNFRIHSRSSYQKSSKISPKYFIASRITACTIFCTSFQWRSQEFAKEMYSHLWHSMFNVIKQFISKQICNVQPSIYISSKSFCTAQCSLVDLVLWQLVPLCLKYFLQSICSWLGMKYLAVFKHNSQTWNQES